MAATMGGVRRVLNAVAARSRAEAATFGDLDAKAGDGDLGVTLGQAVDALERSLDDLAARAPSDLFREASRILGASAASTFTTLIRLGGRRAADAVRERADWSQVTAADVAQALELAVEAIEERGGASPGDKTLLDALAPAATAACGRALAGATVRETVHAAAQAAQTGADATATMVATAGRAAWMAARGTGYRDPGAVVVATWLSALDDALNA